MVPEGRLGGTCPQRAEGPKAERGLGGAASAAGSEPAAAPEGRLGQSGIRKGNLWAPHGLPGGRRRRGPEDVLRRSPRAQLPRRRRRGGGHWAPLPPGARPGGRTGPARPPAADLPADLPALLAATGPRCHNVPGPHGHGRGRAEGPLRRGRSTGAAGRPHAGLRPPVEPTGIGRAAPPTAPARGGGPRPRIAAACCGVDGEVGGARAL
mmetsp:Transcript_8966/g.21600  ORF Transcript_8966/g.21600 Transcript_8966/m.21600 type:complete len:209 (-) Transcript_8966:294-920(-)